MASLNHPAIGLSLLKAILRRGGYKADIRHLYFEFAEYIGLDAYEAINDDRYFLALVGEWLFAPEVHDSIVRDDIGYVSRVLLGERERIIDANRLLHIFGARKSISGFLDHCMKLIDWSAYDIIGFSSSFQQSMASLALAKRIKELFPTKFIVFGGANCEGEMGTELHRLYGFIDAVVAGEAELTFPELVRRYFSGQPLNGLDGVTVRVDGTSIPADRPSSPIAQLDELPMIDYDDFYADRNNAPQVAASFDAVPLFESARGCWWGEKHHCTFCGLNALGMSYRSKSQDRAYTELVGIADRYGREILVVDNILNNSYFEGFLPRLAAVSPPVLMHYEVKANLRAAQLASLARAGVRKIQPGIESFSTNALRLMRKGTTMLRNVQTLKLAAEAGVFVEWGHLYGFPGETADDYRAVLDLIPLLTHLSPPSGVTRVRADRFSPYFNSTADFGITINPLPAYAYVFPYGETSIRKLAYHFDISRSDEQDLEGLYQQLYAALQAWNDRASASKLVVNESATGWAMVYDRRAGTEDVSFELPPPAARALAIAAEICGLRQLHARLRTEFAPPTASTAIDHLLEHHLLLREGDEVLTLALRQPGLERAPLKTEIRHSLTTSYFHRSSVFEPEPGA